MRQQFDDSGAIGAMQGVASADSVICKPQTLVSRMTSITVDGALSRAELSAIVDGAPVQLDPAARERMWACHSALITWLDEGRHVYGASSGVGDFRDIDVAGEAREQLQLNIVRSHCCGVGAALPQDIVRAALALRVATFSRGHSAVRPQLAEHMIEMLNAHIHPVVPEFGSVGASGDPVLLAHLALGIIGEGYAQIEAGSTVPSCEALALHGLEPMALVSREGLALVNGLDFTIGAGVLITTRAQRLLGWADAIAALTLDVLRALEDPFMAEVQRIRGEGRHSVVAERISRLRSGASCEPHEATASQDPYCLRCIPQVHGASWTAFDRYAATVDGELTAVIDNPLVFVGEGAIRHCGHFHGQELALTADYLALAVANLANIAQARLSLLLRGARDLPKMLSPAPGYHSGLMMLETTCASLVARIRALAAPLSVHSIAASSEQEDHTSMSWEAVRRTDALLPQLAYVLAAEGIAAAAAVSLRRSTSLGRGTRALLEAISSQIGTFGEDRPLSGDIEALVTMILQESSTFADGA
jgi:histidine ammonia-lyase